MIVPGTKCWVFQSARALVVRAPNAADPRA